MSLTKPSRQDFLPAGHAPPEEAARELPRESREDEVFLSWGGVVYGPSTPDEVAAGVRSGWFDVDAVFWFDGQTEWRPVKEFPGLHEVAHHTLGGHRTGATPEGAPPLPLPRSRQTSSGRTRSRHADRTPGKTGSSRRRGNRGHSSKTGRALVLGALLLAIAATVALLFLLMRF